jgi:regulator of protease activity HflC (stomatin/prohibitin superfamily)
VLAAHLEHVHPPVDVVPAYRDVASAQEERETAINRAEAYALEQVPLAQGRGRALVKEADAYRVRRVEHSQGESERFQARARAAALAPGLTTFRLHLESLEEVLPGRRKYLVSGADGGGRRFLFFGADTENLLRLTEPGRSGGGAAPPPETTMEGQR